MPYIGTCFRFYTQMRVQKKKHLHIEFIVTSHNSAMLDARLQTSKTIKIEEKMSRESHPLKA